MAKKKAADSDQTGATSGINKAQAIRDKFAAMGRKTRPKDIIAALAAEGIEVSAAQVSNIKSSLGIRSKRKVAANGAATGAKPPEKVDVSALVDAKKFVLQAGSLEKAKQAIDVLMKLR